MGAASPSRKPAQPELITPSLKPQPGRGREGIRPVDPQRTRCDSVLTLSRAPSSPSVRTEEGRESPGIHSLCTDRDTESRKGNYFPKAADRGGIRSEGRTRAMEPTPVGLAQRSLMAFQRSIGLACGRGFGGASKAVTETGRVLLQGHAVGGPTPSREGMRFSPSPGHP